MEQNIYEKISQKLDSWSKVAWSNQDIMICLDVGITSASSIHQQAKRHKGMFRGTMKNKVKADVVCEMLGIDRNEEVKKLVEYLQVIKGGE